ncbi:TPA: cupin domain-containing protein [bacterium]|nr:cupin domain-containing protein [bacterium]
MKEEKYMPIIKREDFGTDRAPDWAKVTGGINAMGCSTRDKSSPQVELHYHDAEEFWFVLQGKAKVMTDGNEYIVGIGDIVCTKMGEEHAILEVIEEPYTQVWLECNLRGQKRTGHLHR